MEFLKTINHIRQNLPYAFYMLLVVVPSCTILVMICGLKDLGIEWEWNIFFIGIMAFLIGSNLTFWLKSHYQRMNDFKQAKRSVVIFDVLFIGVGLAIILFYPV